MQRATFPTIVLPWVWFQLLYWGDTQHTAKLRWPVYARQDRPINVVYNVVVQ